MIALALAAISTGVVPRAMGLSNTPTFVLGVTSSLDPLVVDLHSQTSSLTLLSGVSGLSLIGPGSILFIDGNWLQSASALDPTILPTIDATVLSGIPSVVVRGTPTVLQNSISGLIKVSSPNLPLIAEGLKVFSTLSDGSRQTADLQVIAGFDYAVSAEFTWAQQKLTNALPTGPSPLSSAASKMSRLPAASSAPPSWLLFLQHTTDTGTQFSPMAEIVSTFTIFSLSNSGTSAFRWYNFFANQTLIPGSVAFNSPWRNDNENDTINVNPSTNTLISHGPTGLITAGPATVSYTIGVTAGQFGAVVTANQTQSYGIKNTSVTDASQSASEVGWLHSIDPRSSSGKLQFSIIPGWTDQIQASGSIDLHGTFTSTFATLSGTNIQQTASTTVQLAVGGG